MSEGATETGVEAARAAKALFERLVDLDPESRRRQLDEVCQANAALRSRVERLLENAPSGDGFLALSVWEDCFEGQRLGRYRVGRRIGEGGSGSVHVAERVEGDFPHRVAVKFLRRGLASAAARRRFERERTILAAISHPGIAQLLDGGTTDEGVPFVVMEYVDGLPITRFCDNQRLSVRERLLIFQRVCHAVGFVHRSLVVHCDLKPGNILVTAEGVPKLLDFGIARLLENEASDTATQDRVLTLGYASPEQLIGAPVTAASDTFALGILLYELLVGQLPFDRSGYLPGVADPAAVCAGYSDPSRRLLAALAKDGEAERRELDRIASARSTRPVGLARQLAGDLDNIVRRALEPEPRDRYAGPGELARDLDLHLDGFPVSARPPRIAYRMAKFVRRRTDVCVAAALILGLAATAMVQSLRWRSERDTALAERTRAGRIERVLLDSMKLTDPERELRSTITARELLDRAAGRISTFSDQPGLQASMAATLGSGYFNLGLYAEARQQYESALRFAGEEPRPLDDTAARAQMGLVETLVELGEFGLATRIGREALEGAAGRVVAGEPEAGLRMGLAISYLRLGDLDPAEREARRAIALLERVGATGMEARASLALETLARVLAQRGELEEAEAMMRQSIERLSPGDTDVMAADRSAAQGSLAMILIERGAYSGAESILREVLAKRRAELPPRHPLTAIAANNLGVALLRQGVWSEAELLLIEALSIRREKLPPGHPDIAQSANNLASLRWNTGSLADAERLFDEAIAIEVERFGADHPNLGTSYSNRALVRWNRGAFLAAEEDSSRALAAFRRSPAPKPVDLANALVNRGGNRAELGRFEEAGADLDAALSMLRASEPAHPSVAAVLNARARLSELAGDPSQAEAGYAAAHDLVVATVGVDHPWAVIAQANRTAVRTLLGQPLGAVDRLDELASQAVSALGPRHSETLRIRHNAAVACAAAGELEAASARLRAVVADRTESLGPSHPDTVQSRLELSAVLLRRGERGKAGAELGAGAAAIRASLGDAHWMLELIAGLEAAVRADAEGFEAARHRLAARFPAPRARAILLLDSLAPLVLSAGD